MSDTIRLTEKEIMRIVHDPNWKDWTGIARRIETASLRKVADIHERYYSEDGVLCLFENALREAAKEGE